MSRFIKDLRRNKETHRGYSLVEILVSLLIVAVIAGVASATYINARSRQYVTIASNDGDAIFREVQAAFGSVNSFGTTNGTMTYTNSTGMMAIIFGTGGDVLAPFAEKVSAGTTLSGVTYGNSTSWCMDVANKGYHVFFTQEGIRSGATACPISGLSYSSTIFTRGSDNQQLSPTNTTGGSGSNTYTITGGILPPGVTFDTTTGVFSGPISAAWSFKSNQISSGMNYSCAVTTTGGIKCWGDNSKGQLGDGDTVTQSTPVDVQGMTSGMSSVYAGSAGTTCALSSTGGLWCWGNNARGQFGNGTTTDAYAPVPVSGMSSGVTDQIGVGADNVCAVLTSGAVKCWGDNTYGQLGNGTTTASLTPTPVNGYSSGGAAKVTVGGDTACLITTSGGLKCWGNSTNGQMGTGSNSQSLTPIDVVGLTSGVGSVSEGTLSGCAVISTSGVKCWGYNSNGQLGNGSTTQSLTPVAVSGLSSGVLQVGVGTNSACAVTTVGSVYCWGQNNYGQLGDNTTTDSSTPIAVTGLTLTISQLGVGNTHVCALNAAQAVTCWGLDTSGQLGDGIVTQRTTPTTVTNLIVGPGNVPSFNQTCALTSVGGIKCWGNNGKGQVGNGNKNSQTVPVDVVGLTSGVTQVSTGTNFTCALTTGNNIKCWGDNAQGQLGNGGTTGSLTAVAVSGLPSGSIQQVTAGTGFACSLMQNGNVYCWGDNTYGQLGNGTTTSSTTPVLVSNINNATSIAAGFGPFTCAILASGAVQCWGNNSNGQLGNGTTTSSSIPAQVTGITSGATSISAGPTTACAVVSAALKCWGYNGNGQLGNGSTTQSLVPTGVSGLSSGVLTVSVGEYHACAVLSTTGIKCWGYNGFGELGDGTLIQRLSPVNVTALTSGVQYVAAGQYSTCATLIAGGADCWGLDTSGQLGIGTQTQQISPVATNYTGMQPGFPSTVTVTVSDASGSTSTTVTLTTT